MNTGFSFNTQPSIFSGPIESTYSSDDLALYAATFDAESASPEFSFSNLDTATLETLRLALDDSGEDTPSNWNDVDGDGLPDFGSFNLNA